MFFLPEAHSTFDEEIHSTTSDSDAKATSMITSLEEAIIDYLCSDPDLVFVMFMFMHLADAFIQSDLQMRI